MSDLLDLPDLAGERFGGTVVACSDDFFGSARRLLHAAPPVSRKGTFDENGQWMDGWESSRRRDGRADDWVVIRLGAPGIVRLAVIDTSFFDGNQPSSAFLQGACLPGNPSPAEVLAAEWTDLLADVELQPDQVHVLPLEPVVRVTHVRLTIRPDGGVARLRLHGVAVPDPASFDGVTVDLAAAQLGGEVVACSDMHFGRRTNLIAPGESRVMAEGWETRRRRGPGHDWALVRLAGEGSIRRVVVDTRLFRGNAPASCDLETSPAAEGPWRPLLSDVRLQPDQAHDLVVASLPVPHTARWVRLSVHPDGGVSRLRVLGALTIDGRRELAMSWLLSSPDAVTEAALLGVCGSREWVRLMMAARPWAGGLLQAADDVWAAVGPDDWREALAAHPRIGDRTPAGSQESREQAATAAADQSVLAEIAAGNLAYEEKFGMTYVVRASGRSIDELVAMLRTRMGNTAEAELAVAAAEQAEITALRLARLLDGPG
jgi:allantoicase